MTYQGSPFWDRKGLRIHKFMYSSSTVWEDKHAAFNSPKAVRGMSAQSLAQYMETNATKRFT